MCNFVLNSVLDAQAAAAEAVATIATIDEHKKMEEEKRANVCNLPANIT